MPVSFRSSQPRHSRRSSGAVHVARQSRPDSRPIAWEKDSEPGVERPRRRDLRLNVAAFGAFLALALVMQIWVGAYRTERGNFPDEAGHFMNGMLVRDYLTDGLGENPMQFARQYYLNYPKIAPGMWPPLYHGLLGIFLLPGWPPETAALLPHRARDGVDGVAIVSHSVAADHAPARLRDRGGVSLHARDRESVERGDARHRGRGVRARSDLLARAVRRLRTLAARRAVRTRLPRAAA